MVLSASHLLLDRLTGLRWLRGASPADAFRIERATLQTS